MDEKYEIDCKVVFCGGSGVGKTNLIQRISYNIFEETQMATHGASFCSKTITSNNYLKKLNLNIWDTSGALKYINMNKFLIKDANIIILVMDYYSQSWISTFLEVCKDYIPPKASKFCITYNIF